MAKKQTFGDKTSKEGAKKGTYIKALSKFILCVSYFL